MSSYYLLLKAVRWREFTDVLLGLNGPETDAWIRRRAVRVNASTIGRTLPAHAALAMAVQAAIAPDIRGALTGVAPTLTKSQVDDVAEWLRHGAAAFLDLAESAPTSAFTSGAGSRPPAARELPLQELCQDLTQNHGLTILMREGLARRGQTHLPDRVIVLDPTATDLDYVLSHELGHLLDPDYPRPLHLHNEQFADELGALLLEHRPRTCTEAQPLIDRVAAAPWPEPLIDLPDDRLGTLLAFTGLRMST
ncbi:hypothetical protein BH10ACT8_BH10ACT8_18130 [soil metagenome]